MRIIFFFPSNTLGGVQTLFIRLINQLDNTGYQTGYIDFDDGVMRTQLKENERVEYYPIRQVGAGSEIGAENCTIITSLNFINVAPLYIAPQAKILLWCLSPYNLPIRNLNRKLKINLEKWHWVKATYKGFSNLNRAERTRAVYFMDRFSYHYNKCTQADYDPFLPIYLDLEFSGKSYRNKSESISMYWVGRIDSSLKFHCVVFLIKCFESLMQSSLAINARLTLIGDGAGAKKIKRMCDRSPVSSNINHINELAYSELKGHLSTHADIVFAHGTSCLESAAIGIPTVCLDPYGAPFRRDYKFKWFHELEPYNIGITEFGSEYSQQGHSIEQIIEQLSNEREVLSEKAVSAVSSQYNHDLIFSKLISATNNTTLYVGDLRLGLFSVCFDMLVHWYSFGRKVFLKAFYLCLKKIKIFW